MPCTILAWRTPCRTTAFCSMTNVGLVNEHMKLFRNVLPKCKSLTQLM